MPPIRTPPKPKKGDEAQILVLFAKNLEEVRRHFRGARTPGNEHGINVVTEHVLSYVSEALSLAMEGKSWGPPKE